MHPPSPPLSGTEHDVLAGDTVIASEIGGQLGIAEHDDICRRPFSFRRATPIRQRRCPGEGRENT